MKKHIGGHTGENPYKCILCQQYMNADCTSNFQILWKENIIYMKLKIKINFYFYDVSKLNRHTYLAPDMYQEIFTLFKTNQNETSFSCTECEKLCLHTIITVFNTFKWRTTKYKKLSTKYNASPTLSYCYSRNE